jgi:acyl-CoA hydrolase
MYHYEPRQDFLKEYQKKFAFPDDAVKIVTSGSRVHYVFGVENSLDMALAKRKDELKNIVIYSHIKYYCYSVQKIDNSGEHFTILNTPFINTGLIKDERQMSLELRACKETKSFMGPSIFMAIVSPMDVYGYFWFAPGVPSECQEAARRAQHVVVEINENIPNSGSMRIHISEISCVVPGINSPIRKTAMKSIAACK